MQNLEIVAIVKAYVEQKKEKRDIALPARVAWARHLNIDRLIKAKSVIDSAIGEVEQRYMDDAHSYADGDLRQIKPEYAPELVKARMSILVQDTPVEIQTVSVSEIASLTLTDADMETLGFMLTE